MYDLGRTNLNSNVFTVSIRWTFDTSFKKMFKYTRDVYYVMDRQTDGWMENYATTVKISLNTTTQKANVQKQMLEECHLSPISYS